LDFGPAATGPADTVALQPPHVLATGRSAPVRKAPGAARPNADAGANLPEDPLDFGPAAAGPADTVALQSPHALATGRSAPVRKTPGAARPSADAGANLPETLSISDPLQLVLRTQSRSNLRTRSQPGGARLCAKRQAQRARMRMPGRT